MKIYILITLLLGLSSHATASCYIGDSIAHGYRTYNKAQGITKVGANPSTVLTYVKRSSCSSPIILSTGISNNPTDFKSVHKQLQALQSKQVIMLGTSTSFPKYGNKLNVELNKICKLYTSCTFNGGFKASRDKVHPISYNQKF